MSAEGSSSLGQARRNYLFSSSANRLFLKAFVGVVDHQWFTTTDKEGNFALPSGLAPGRYMLAAVHPKSGELTQEITISGSDNPSVNFTFEVPTPFAAQ